MTRKTLPITVTLDAEGNMVIPAEQRRALGLEAGQRVTLRLDMQPQHANTAAAIERIQQLVRRHVPAGVSLVDELLAERRAEVNYESDSDTL